MQELVQQATQLLQAALMQVNVNPTCREAVWGESAPHSILNVFTVRNSGTSTGASTKRTSSWPGHGAIIVSDAAAGAAISRSAVTTYSRCATSAGSTPCRTAPHTAPSNVCFPLPRCSPAVGAGGAELVAVRQGRSSSGRHGAQQHHLQPGQGAGAAGRLFNSFQAPRVHLARAYRN